MQSNPGVPPKSDSLPEDPGQEALPIAQPEPEPPSGVPVQISALHQSRVGDIWTLNGEVVIHYRDYVLRAEKVIYHQTTSELDAEGNLQVSGGHDDIALTASHGDMRLNMHTARFYDVTGTMGVHRTGRAAVYSTPNPFIFSARVLLQTGEGSYKVIDGSMTNCRLPKPDWQLLSRAINLSNGLASTSNTYFKLFGVPIFYLPYLRHPIDQNGRESGFLIPVISNGSSIRGSTFGEQFYWVINRSMDMIIGSEYYSRRGWAPNGDFRYKGEGLDHVTARWNALFDRGVEQVQTTGAQTGQSIKVNQGGVDMIALGRKDFSPETRVAGNVEYLSNYIYRLVFNDNYWVAVSSEVKSDVSLTHSHNGLISSAWLARNQTFASPKEGDEARILHLPSLHYDVLDRPLGPSPFSWGMASSASHLGRSEPGLHAHNVARIDAYPHLSMPIVAGGWSIVPEAALRATIYSGSQVPDLSGTNGGVPSVSHSPLQRTDAEASLDLRPPALERDYNLGHWNRLLRHVIEPEFTYQFVGGIGGQARKVLVIDKTDIATDTNEVGFSLTQRFYLRPKNELACVGSDEKAGGECPAKPREWASWQVAQKYYLDPNFGGALIRDRRNVFDATLDLRATCLPSPRDYAFRPSITCALNGTWTTTQRLDAWAPITCLRATVGVTRWWVWAMRY
jgi:LPS-assembly protein